MNDHAPCVRASFLGVTASLSLFVDPLSRRSLGEDYAPAGRALK